MLYHNLALLSARQSKEPFAVLATRRLSTHKIVTVYDRTSIFPLYLYPLSIEPALMDSTAQTPSELRSANFSSAFIADMAARLGLRFALTPRPPSLTGNGEDGSSLLPGETFGPEDVFHYIYAILHSPTYRARYAEFLKIDFPRVPLTRNLALFRALAARGAELAALHLLESPALDTPITRFTARSDDFSRPQAAEAVSTNLVATGYPRYDHDTVWVNPSAGFAGMPEAVWQFQVGGYQVCHKWLKDRRGRVLTTEDTTHYGKIVVALNETIRLMGEIDETIEKHGGWPIQ